MLSNKNTNAHSSQPQRQLLSTVRFGFALVLALALIIGGVALYQLYHVNASMSSVVKVNNAKTELAFVMRDAIRLRALTLNQMLASDDYFKRDQDLLRFYDFARIYRQAREQFEALATDRHERELLEKLSQHALVSQPLNRLAAEYLLATDVPANFHEIMAAAQTQQEQLLDLLDESVKLQKQYAHQALSAAQQKYRYTVVSLLAVVLVLLSIGAMVAHKVVRYVGEKNRDLAENNAQLERANENTRKATRAKSEFLASMSHEIRTPLTTILGFSETLLEPDLSSDEQYKAVTAIN
ncbi:histidine kinase dimerization/phospho-acceptor domain-containing protein, partial [Kaarinaea lacus]